MTWRMEQRPAHVTYYNVLVNEATGEEYTVSYCDDDWNTEEEVETFGPFETVQEAMDCGVYHEGHLNEGPEELWA